MEDDVGLGGLPPHQVKKGEIPTDSPLIDWLAVLTPDGHYVADTIREALKAKGLDLRAKPGRVPGPGPHRFLQLLEQKQRLRDLKTIEAAQVDEINQYFKARSAELRVKQQIELSSLRIKGYRETLEEEKALLAKERAVYEGLKSAVEPAAEQLLSSHRELLIHKQELDQARLELAETRNRLVEVQLQSQQRKFQFFRILSQIYQIRPPEGGPGGPEAAKYFSINGVVLPNSEFRDFDDEAIATALGHVAHLVYLLSKFLDVPLRYPMTPMCSRSSIRDEIGQADPLFYLYSKNVDRTRFEYGVFLLNKNVEQVLASQGLEAISLRHTLPNLYELLKQIPEPGVPPSRTDRSIARPDILLARDQPVPQTVPLAFSNDLEASSYSISFPNTFVEDGGQERAQEVLEALAEEVSLLQALPDSAEKETALKTIHEQQQRIQETLQDEALLEQLQVLELEKEPAAEPESQPREHVLERGASVMQVGKHRKVVWYWQNEHGQLTQFSAEATQMLEKAFLSEAQFCDIRILGRGDPTHRARFSEMTMEALRNPGNFGRISRVVESMSAELPF